MPPSTARLLRRASAQAVGMRGVIDCGPGYDVVYTGHRKPRARNCEKLVNRWTAARRAMVG
jgi:hypothetical protein